MSSIENIINSHVVNLEQCEIKMLFQKKTYPRFQLGDFQENHELFNRSTFVFFYNVLDKWNEAVQSRKPTLNNTEYVKNQFIFSWLKSLAVQSEQFIDTSLRRLYTWYNSNKPHQVECVLKNTNINKSRLEDWEIRNSFKSNLPLEIDNYRRRYLFGPKDCNQKPLNKCNEKEDIKPIPSSIFLTQNQTFKVRSLKKENNYLRIVRQDKEVDSYLKDYKKSKLYLYQDNTKNYFKNQFQRDKLTASTSTSPQNKNLLTHQIVDSRIKTAMGMRPLKLIANQPRKTISYSNLYKDKLSSDSHYKYLMSNVHNAETQQNKLPAIGIDGLGLMSNPLDAKISKKKKNKKK